MAQPCAHVAGGVAVSALTGQLVRSSTRSRRSWSPRCAASRCYSLFDRGDLVSLIHERGLVLKETHRAGGTLIVGQVPDSIAFQLAEFSA